MFVNMVNHKIMSHCPRVDFVDFDLGVTQYLRVKHGNFFKTLAIVFPMLDYLRNDQINVQSGPATTLQLWR